MKDVLYATGCFEIGDMFLDEDGKRHIITDVLVCHYIRGGTFRVKYEVDRSGKFEDLQPVPADARPSGTKNRSTLQLIPMHAQAESDGGTHL